MSVVVQVLVDADNVAPARIAAVLAVLAERNLPARIVASGRPSALERTSWPDEAELLAHEGWQQADLALAAAYSPDAEPLILITGDGDFGQLARRHPGPVLVISGAASGQLRGRATVADPATDGLVPIRNWLQANGATTAS